MLESKFSNLETRIGIIGLGYVGLPLATVFAEADYRVLGFDVSRAVCDGINAGQSHIKDIPTPRLTPLVEQGLVEATTDFERGGFQRGFLAAGPNAHLPRLTDTA